MNLTFEQKWDACLASLPAWTENPDTFSFETASAATGIQKDELETAFEKPAHIPRFFYEAAIDLYHETREATEGFEDFTLSEKLTHFACSLFDIFSSQPEFVKKSMYPLLLNAPGKAFFFDAVARQFSRFVDGDERASSLTRIWTPEFIFDFWAYEFGHVLRFWLKDSSENKEKTLALVDKLSGFVQELYYNTTADRGIDLAKFFWQERIIKLPFGLDGWFRK